MSKLLKVDPLLEMLRNHANEIADWDEEDKRYFCVNWDLCRDKLLEIMALTFEDAEKLMHEFGEEYFDLFQDYFCAPHLLAELIKKDFFDNKFPF